MSRWVAWLPFAALALLAVLFAGFGLRHDPHVNPAALVGKPLPRLTLPSLDGGPAQPLRAALGSEPALVNVFASWCTPCAAEAPTLETMQKSGARIVGVAYKDDPGATRAFLQKYGDPFAAVLSDRDGRAGIDLGISGVPETFLVGRDGRVIAKRSGPLSADDAQALLEQAR